jgi:myo-inositol 2-dehydrogenase/D-chiro-inositol 1-dehydrogenase
MRFALLGNHPHGVAFARALLDSGRHELVAFTSPIPFDVSRRPTSVSSSTAVVALGSVTDRQGATAVAPPAQRTSDLEEILADPAIDAIVVAGPLSDRPALLRRALQSERHVLCVHPADERPEIAYEAGMIRQDVNRILMPLLPDALHPGIIRLAEFIDRADAPSTGALGAFRLLEVERRATGAVLSNLETAGARASFPGWEVLRRLGGEIAEVSGFATEEDLDADAPVLLAGRFAQGGLFQMTLLPRQPDERCTLTVVGERGRAEVLFPLGWDGPAQLGWRDADGEYREEYWDQADPWPTLVELFEARLAAGTSEPKAESAVKHDWQDEIRALELDDAARRSVQKRRTSLLEYAEASEEVGFKGTMTLVGCAMLWVVLLLLILSRWAPVLGWLIVPLLAIFLGLQFLRYAVPVKQEKDNR